MEMYYNLIKMHDKLQQRYRKSVYRILKQNGITNQLKHANTYQQHGGENDGQCGYIFEMKNGDNGKIILHPTRIVWD
jgi:hypothetical protein